MPSARTARNFAVAAALLGCGICAGQVRAEDKPPINIGVPLSLTGPNAEYSEQGKRAVEFAVAQINANGGVKGRNIALRFADTEAKPDVTRKQIEKLALEGYNLLYGTTLSTEGLAVAPFLKRWDALLVAPFSKSSKLIGESCQARFFRTIPSDPSDMVVVKDWLKTRDEQQWISIASDFAFGHDATEGFKDAATKSSKQVVESLFPPFGTTDFAPYIQQIKSSAAKGVFVILASRDAVNFLSQAKQYGLLGSKLMGGIIYTQDSIVKAVGPSVEGLWGGINYTASLDTPENVKFVAAWKQAHNGTEPTDIEGQGYIGFTVLLQAIERADSTKPVDVAKALSGGTFDTPLGQVKMRAEDHQLVLPNYYGQVKLVDGNPRNVVTMSIPAEEATPAPDPACKMGPA